LNSFVICAAIVAIALMPLPTSAHEDSKPIGEAIKRVPIFDAHVHYKQPAWQPFPVTTVLELMDASGVAMALVSSTPDEGTIKLWKFAPRRIVPELRPYHDQFGSSNWMTTPGMAEYLRKKLAAYPHKGIGEFHIHDVRSINKPLLYEIVAIAKKRNILIHIHSDAEPVRFLFGLEPKLTVIWAHAGMTESAATVEKMMAKYSSLYADTSYRERDILSSTDTIDSGRRKFIERFPDRFMVGTDTWVNSQWTSYRKLVEINRKWLSHFPRSVAEKIAYRNAEKLFDRKITSSLIGER